MNPSPLPSQRARVSVLVVANLVMAWSLGFSEVFISDDFSLHGKERTVGMALNNLPAQRGAASWIVPNSSSAIFSSEGAISAGGDSPTCQALVAIQDPVGKIVVQADVITQGSGWVAVGFQTSERASWFAPGSLIFVNLSPTGGWMLYRDQGSLKSLGGGTVENFSPADKYNLALQYDPATSMANVLINGEDVSGPVDTAFPISTEIGAAGFFIYPAEVPSGTAQVDNFQVMDAKN